MKEILLQFAKYNLWANKRIIEVMLQLGEAQLDMEMVSSFPTIRKTVYHTWSAEYIWVQRLQLAEHPVWIETGFAGSFAEACNEWQKASESLVQFIEKQLDNRAFEHVFQYYNLQKQFTKMPVYTALTHAFNHSTQHRGQLITMLRQAGVSRIPGTDMILFVK